MVKEGLVEGVCPTANYERIEEDNRWSNLPALLLWMIKGKLDLPNNLRFAAVCKSWLHASLNYQSTVDHAPPWLMITQHFCESTREFISSSTGEMYTIDLPDFCDARFLFSMQGWLLLDKLEQVEGEFFRVEDIDPEFDSPFFLLNPFTKAKIKLPNQLARRGCYEAFAFDVVDGYPHCVVAANTDFITGLQSPCISLLITHPGDNTWATYTYKVPNAQKFSCVAWVVVIGKLVYCMSMTARVIIFDLENLEWADPMGKDQVSYNLEMSIMESQGKLLHVHLPKKNEARNGVFYRLNDSNTDWELLNEKDLEDTCWFLRKGGLCCSFVFKGKRADKIYTYCRDQQEAAAGEDGSVIFLFSEGRKLRGGVLVDLVPKHFYWVDMGC
ncbi:hypothetical protein Vadar_011412 [Vaccinium darrowii]|uniref:Uncharacterized protein n=1 Tax=Vaccinium darrowii TaxID=229202 RepID=A0ACB7Y630_9ERIC|nr:hypothetical protein Vadar_011412 [Vaccinium darrowii]